MATLLRTIRNTIHRLSLRRRKKHNRRKSENTADEVDATFVTAHDLTDDDNDNTITVELHNSDKMDTEERKSRKSSENEKDTEATNSDGEEKDDEATTRPKVKKKYNLKKMISSTLLNPDFENCEPEICVKMMQAPNVKTVGLLKRKIKQSDKSWIQGFLEGEGLSVLLDCVDSLSGGRVTQLSEALLLLEVVDCIKTVINSKLGMDYLVEADNDTKKLIKGKSYIIPLLSLYLCYSTVQDVPSTNTHVISLYRTFQAQIHMLFHYTRCLVWFMVFNATFNNISAISCRSVLLVEETIQDVHSTRSTCYSTIRYVQSTVTHAVPLYDMYKT
jgi:hypothetical protein